MLIKNHRLYLDPVNQVRFVESPNKYTSKPEYKYLIIHYTASDNMDGTLSHFKNPAAEASAHLVIGRDGTIVQMVPFNQKAWHAGKSNWEGLENINQYSIGIEIVNAGKLENKTSGGWLSWFQKVIPDEEVLVAKHKNESKEVGWHLYTEKQIEVVSEVSALIVKAYGLSQILGHEDVSPYRKSDPGPAFPMNSFVAKIMGRKTSPSELHQVNTELNIRTGPGSQYSRLDESPLPVGTKVEILDNTHPTWRFVDVLDPVQGVSGIQGWVHGGYITRI